DPWQRRLPQLKLEGNPLGEVAKYLGELFPEINFVVAPEDSENIAIGVDLRSVGLEDIFSAINLSSKGRVEAERVSDRMVHFKLVETPPPQPAQKRQCVAFSLGRYLAGKEDKKE